MMAYIDPDQPNQKLGDQLAAYYEQAADRLSKIVIAPPRSTDSAREFNQARAASQLHQVQGEIARLKREAANWTGTAVQDAVNKGIDVADRQARLAGVRTLDPRGLQGSFASIDREMVRVIAQDTIGDLVKAADSMERVAGQTLRRMAATGVTNAQVNDILAGRLAIEGQPQQAIRDLRQLLEKVHGKAVTITDKNGDPISFKTGYYAKMVANTKGREAANKGRHARLQAHGLDLVKVIGVRSKNPCSLLLGRIFSLSGKDPKHPAFSTVSEGQEPYRLFHPNCSKSTAPFIADLAESEAA